ncbi:MAG: hypothetical protein Fur0025_25030 [Oscillatoriaceae cyanobacterium]
MTILIANIGTSDLAVKLDIDGHPYYLPIDFLAEPNLPQKVAELSPELQAIWNSQSQHLQSLLYPELGLASTKQRSRDITQLLLKNYEHWQSRLSFVRIFGVINQAKALDATKAYIFVTDQKGEKMPNGHDKDTIFLYQLLERWLQDKNLGLTLVAKTVPGDKNANDLESMLDFYETALADIRQTDDQDDCLFLVSIKGGTPAMGTALQLQAMDAGFKKIVFLDPQLSLPLVLAGKPSGCKLTMYWGQLHAQKYRTLHLLLDRWDFDGAITVIKDWQKTISVLPPEVASNQISELSERQTTAIHALQLASCLFNFDRLGAQNILSQHQDISSLSYLETDYESWLNLLSHCQIYWNLEQMANFLWCLSSFWEDVLNYLIEKLNGSRYFFGNLDDWQLDKSQLEPELWKFLPKKDSKLNNWDFAQDGYYSLRMKRITKRYLVRGMVDQQNPNSAAGKILDDCLKALNYWVDKRNDLIHRVKGASKQTMREMLATDRAAKNGEAKIACDVDNLVVTMKTLSKAVFDLLELPPHPTVSPEDDSPAYIYSEIIAFVEAELRL